MKRENELRNRKLQDGQPVSLPHSDLETYLYRSTCKCNFLFRSLAREEAKRNWDKLQTQTTFNVKADGGEKCVKLWVYVGPKGKLHGGEWSQEPFSCDTVWPQLFGHFTKKGTHIKGKTSDGLYDIINNDENVSQG